jgi:hypothetical protein
MADFSDNIAKVFAGGEVTSNTTFYLNASFIQNRLIEFDANEAMNNNQKKSERCGSSSIATS